MIHCISSCKKTEMAKMSHTAFLLCGAELFLLLSRFLNLDAIVKGRRLCLYFISVCGERAERGDP